MMLFSNLLALGTDIIECLLQGLPLNTAKRPGSARLPRSNLVSLMGSELTQRGEV